MWALIVLALMTFNTRAETLELKKDQYSIYFEEVSDWSLSRDLFGIPFIYFSPQTNGQRSNISFNSTNVELQLDFKSLNASQDKYKENKEAWSEKVNATPLKFLPLKSFINKNGHKVYSIGFDYQHQEKTYSEMSYYIECKGKLIFSKSLRLKENVIHDVNFDHIISSLNCGEVK